MSTRSIICLEQEDGTYQGIYCHHDGYPSYNGALLLDHYSERAKVERLMSLGDVSLLAELLDPNPLEEHSFNHPQNKVTLFYHRDNQEKEENTKSQMVFLEQINKPNSWIDFCYVFTLKNEWKYFRCGETKEIKLRDLSASLEEIYKEAGIQRPRGYYGFLDIVTVHLLKEKEKGRSPEEGLPDIF